MAPDDARGPAHRQPRCAVCGGGTISIGARDGYDYRRCTACRHLAVAEFPSPATLDALYARYSYDVNHLAALPPVVFRRLAELADRLVPAGRPGRVLDVGFGAGAALEAFGARGWEAYGVETSGLAVERARSKGFPHVVQGDFLSAPFDTRSFDVVLMLELLEHLPDPRSFVECAHALLRPGGLLYLTTPNGAGLSARCLGATWSVVAPPEHLHLFSPASIRRLTRAAGFTSVTVQTHGLNVYECLDRARWPWWRWPSTDPAGRRAFDRVATAYALNRRLRGSRFGRVFMDVLNRGLDLTRLGDGLKVHARRERRQEEGSPV
jgi:SAM-dependent methyltransferase